MTAQPPIRLLLVSRLAFYPIHFAVLRELVARYDVRATIVGAAAADLPSVHRQLGWASPDGARAAGIDVRLLPEADWPEQARWLHGQLDELNPDAVWVQEEPVDLLALEVLAHYRRHSGPRLACAVCENIFPRGGWRTRLRRRLLWPRLDCLLSVAGASVDGIRAAGMPAAVPAVTLVAGIDGPPDEVAPLELPLARPGRLVVGFAGRIVPEKGWRTLVEAVAALEDVAVVFAGEGEDEPELEAALAEPPLAGRGVRLGLLPKADLWRFYAAVDCVVLPSLTTATWKEQFGAVIADAMALGVPVIGSSSGAIPEVIGAAGLVFREGDAADLAGAIARLRDDAALRERLGRLGRERYEREFALPAYADKVAAGLGLTARTPPAQ